jgi:hypothetical protein
MQEGGTLSRAAGQGEGEVGVVVGDGVCGVLVYLYEGREGEGNNGVCIYK